MQNNILQNCFKPSLILPLVASLLYWIYLSITSQMLILHDALGYEQLGTLIYREGWLAYFQKGPLREPLFPLLVSLSMRLADICALPYQAVIKFFHILLLFITQILTLTVMRKLKIHPALCGIGIVYIGVSPSLVNSVLSLYSEILTYPFVLTIILLSTQAVELLSSIENAPLRGRIFLTALALGLTFLTVTLIKAVFELIIPVFLIAFILWEFGCLKHKHKHGVNRTVLFLSVILCIYYLPLTAYKYANKIHNGSFTLTNRGSRALYGNTTRRLDGFTPQRILAAFASLPDKRYCQAVLEHETCSFWDYELSDRLGHEKTARLSADGAPAGQVNRRLLVLSIKNILGHPAVSLFFAGVESLKLFFWETTSNGFVVYPKWLRGIYLSVPFNALLVVVTALLTVFGIGVMLIKVLFCRQGFSVSKERKEEYTLLCITGLMIFSFMAFHSFFLVLKRYLLPIAPLIVILIAYSLQSVLKLQRK